MQPVEGASAVPSQVTAIVMSLAEVELATHPAGGMHAEAAVL
jgi:hypothetical protein